jgi:hypothetical protein
VLAGQLKLQWTREGREGRGPGQRSSTCQHRRKARVGKAGAARASTAGAARVSTAGAARASTAGAARASTAGAARASTAGAARASKAGACNKAFMACISTRRRGRDDPNCILEARLVSSQRNAQTACGAVSTTIEWCGHGAARARMSSKSHGADMVPPSSRASAPPGLHRQQQHSTSNKATAPAAHPIGSAAPAARISSKSDSAAQHSPSHASRSDGYRALCGATVKL